MVELFSVGGNKNLSLCRIFYAFVPPSINARDDPRTKGEILLFFLVPAKCGELLLLPLGALER
jgi:hypothetical protein